MAFARTALASLAYCGCPGAGFFYIKNHGISQELIDAAFAANAQ